MFWGMNVYNILQYYLPPGAILISPKGPSKARGVRLVDLDKDGVQEIIALYRWRGRAHLIILKDNKKHWCKLAEVRGTGFNIDYFDLIDITKDGKLDIIIGWETEVMENILDIYEFKENKLRRLDKDIKYNKIEIKKLLENKVGIIIWKHVLAEAYDIEVLSWDGKKLDLDTGIYPKYFNEVVKYYKERIKELPKAAFYWYYLADAQLKANMNKEALKSIEVGSSFEAEYPSIEDFNELRKRAEP